MVPVRNAPKLRYNGYTGPRQGDIISRKYCYLALPNAERGFLAVSHTMTQTSMSRRIISTIVLLLACIPLFAQKPDGLSRFELETPQTRIHQGGVIIITYTLDASNYEVIGHPSIEKCQVLDMQYEKSKTPEGLHRLTVSYTFKVSGQGPLKLSPMEVKIDGVKVKGPDCYIIADSNKGFGHEWEVARNFLISMGISDEDMKLEFKYETPTLMAFSDDEHLNFVILAKEAYEPYLDHPILAYGLGSMMWQGKGSSQSQTLLHIFDQYDSQLEFLKERSWQYQSRQPSNYHPSPEGVNPMLKGINYSQNSPYNDLYPDVVSGEGKSRCLAGCGPVAMSQILAFHKEPTRPGAVGKITLPDGRAKRVDMSGYRVKYDGTPSDKATLTYLCAASVEARLDAKSTSSSLIDFKSAFQEYWGYSPLCTYVSGHYDFNMLAMLYKELDEGRPLIVADDTHIFVCDGYRGDFLHLNLGWGGYCNGYYRAIIVPEFSQNQLFFKEMLLGLVPGQQSRRKIVTVNIPGTLGKLLTEEEKENVTNLTINGRINGEDIAVIRNMAGAIYLNYYEKGHGSLMVLDLSNAKIDGSGIYLTKNAKNMSFNGRIVRGDGTSQDYAFSIAKLNDSKWNEIVQKGYNNTSSYIIQRSSDGQYYVSFYTKEDTIGIDMFSDCQNLREISLPSSTKKVERLAFDSCESLKTVRNLPSNVHEEAFRGARLYRQ